MRVYIVILNFNNWPDTIECLESVFRNKYDDYRVIVCDNNSKDGSFEHIRAWAEGDLCPWVDRQNPLRNLSWPPISKPIKYVSYNREHAESLEYSKPDFPLTLIQTGKNLGFAGGNNVGLKHALSKGDFDYIWALNNDTVIKEDTLIELVKKAKNTPKLGICGSKLIYYDDPSLIQAYGGARFNKFLALSTHLGAFEDSKAPVDSNTVSNQIDYIVGASMLISKSFLEKVGFLNEEYFLYFEEIDWSIRAKNLFKLDFSPKSIVYHREGATIGANSKKKSKSRIADYYFIRNRVLFTKKYYPRFLPTVYFGVIYSLIKRVFRGEFDRIGLYFNALRGKDVLF